MEHRTKHNIEDRTLGWQLSYWGQLLVLIFGQLLGCRSLRELTDITTAHCKKSFHLGFGKEHIKDLLAPEPEPLQIANCYPTLDLEFD